MTKQLKRLEITLDAKTPVTYTDEGFMLVPAVLTRAGIFDYPERNRKEMRPPDEVFSPASMDSILGKSITMHHPWDMIDLRNVKEHEVGTVIGPLERTTDDMMKGRLLIKDAGTIEYIETSRQRKDAVKVSCGYYNEDDPTPGEDNGQKYDCVQRNIRYNHLAIGVTTPRAGDKAKLTLDNKNNPKGGTMKRKLKAIKLDGILDLPESNIETEKPEEIIEAMQTRTDEMEAGLTKQATEIADLKKTTDEQKAKLDSADAEKVTMQKRIDELSDINGDHFKKGVELRKTIDEAATTLEIDITGKGVKDAKIAIIEKAFDGAKMDGMSDDYINARFDSAVEILNQRRNSDNAAAVRKDGKPPVEEKVETRQDKYNKLHKGA